jgi:HEAT repeat protein
VDRESIHSVIASLRDQHDLSLKREGVIELGYRKEPEIYAYLGELLNDPSSIIRHAAVISLGRYGNPAAVELLAKPKILRSTHENIRWAAVSAIGRLGNYLAIPHLVKAVEDADWVVRNQAVTELKTQIKAMTGDKEDRTARVLVRMLALKDPEIIQLVIDAFCAMGQGSAGLLIETLSSPSSYMRQHAAEALGELKNTTAVPSLIDLLGDSNEWVRQSAAKALGEIEDPRAIEPLVRSLSDNVGGVQKQVMASLVRFGAASTEPLLAMLNHERNKFILWAILRTLGEIRDPKSIPVLARFLRSNFFVLRAAAIRALTEFGDKAAETLKAAVLPPRIHLKTLLSDAVHGDRHTRIRAIRALGDLEDGRARKTLQSMVCDADAGLAEEANKALAQIESAAWGRSGALVVLREIGDASGLSIFTKAIADDAPHVRIEAARGLGRLCGGAAVDSLIKIAETDKDPELRFESMRLLRQCGSGNPAVLESAIRAVRDRDRDVRSQAAGILGAFLVDASIEPLVGLLADRHFSVRQTAEAGLHGFADRVLPRLIQALDDKAWTVRFRAARLLGEMADAAVIPELEKRLDRPKERRDVRGIMKEAIQRIQKRCGE